MHITPIGYVTFALSARDASWQDASGYGSSCSSVFLCRRPPSLRFMAGIKKPG